MSGWALGMVAGAGIGHGTLSLGKCPHPQQGSEVGGMQEALSAWTKDPSISAKTGISIRLQTPLTADSGGDASPPSSQDGFPTCLAQTGVDAVIFILI